MAKAIEEVLHSRTPRRVLAPQVRIVKRIAISSLLLRAVVNVGFLVAEFTVPSLKSQAAYVVWAIIAFLFYFLLEDCVLMAFLLMVYAQMKHRVDVARGQGEV